VVVLLPDEGGHVGSIDVSNAAGTQQLTQAGQGVQVSAAGTPPSAPFVPDAREVDRMFGGALGAVPLAPRRFILYFRDDSDVLTADSEALLPDVVKSIEERRPSQVSIVGHTDTTGTRDYNFRLGLRRAERVRGRLQAVGAAPTELTVESHGEDNPLVPTGDGVSEPRNRRVEVTVR
jgi:outer membrane protein OmpA-like peptidoglycan-associated protein